MAPEEGAVTSPAANVSGATEAKDTREGPGKTQKESGRREREQRYKMKKRPAA